MTDATDDALERLARYLRDCAPLAIAVSGGVDSMTLAFAARRIVGPRVSMFHAVSPAVPPAATARVRAYARRERWALTVLDAGEFSDESYRANPANRCYFCKNNLYGAIARVTDMQIVSGTNLDDLGDWRPGLRAAAEHGVRHPFVEAGIDKARVRAIARVFNLRDVAELPAAPCLSSRVETGIRIDARALGFIDAVERCVGAAWQPSTVRCRVRHEGIVVELDRVTLDSASDAMRETLARSITDLAREHGVGGTIAFATYARGSAFLRGAHDGG